MKLAKVRIENFRQLGTTDKPFELSFTDHLDRVRDFTLLVGPNTSGKTTLLDAIAAALGPTLELFATRPDFSPTPRSVVRHREAKARVTCWLRFSEAEVAFARYLFSQPELRDRYPSVRPDDLGDFCRETKLTWEYPDIRWEKKYGHAEWEPAVGWAMLKTRVWTARLLATGRVSRSDFHRAGGVFTFDQERTGSGMVISRPVWNMIYGVDEPDKTQRRTTNPRDILVQLAFRSNLMPLSGSANMSREFDQVVKRYETVCAPRRIVRVVEDEAGAPDVLFNDGRSDYLYDGLSSGEKMALLLLLRFVADDIHSSVVLLDELELNQHPIWQRKLLHMLPQMGDGNQIIATTHSPYLRDAVRPDAVIDLGSLGDKEPEVA